MRKYNLRFSILLNAVIFYRVSAKQVYFLNFYGYWKGSLLRNKGDFSFNLFNRFLQSYSFCFFYNFNHEGYRPK